MPRRHSNFTVLVIAILSIFTLTGFGCRRPANVGDTLDQPLIVWGLWQESAQMQPIIDAFESQTGVPVEYKKVASVATYERELLAALAEGRGPDVFVIHHTWVEGKRGLMSPAPPDLFDEPGRKRGTERAVQEDYVGVVAKDLIRDGFLYALPTSVDTLALYVNNEILAGSGVARPPSNWHEFQGVVERITRVSRTGVLQQSAAALGTEKNVNRAGDILQLIMLQTQVEIIEADGTVNLLGPLIRDLTQGEHAVTFYTDFSNKSKKVFTWDSNQDFSIDAFAEGETAMMINYSYHIPTIRAKNARLKFSVAPIPQPVGIRVKDYRTFASYWPFTVSNTSRAPVTAWQFVRFLTSGPVADQLNQAQSLPPARKKSAEALLRDPNLGVFAEQALTATSWPRVDIVATDDIFHRMINDVVTGAASVSDALRRAEDQLEQLTQSSSS